MAQQLRRRIFGLAAACFVVTALAALAARSEGADCGYPVESQDLFYNYYVPGQGPCPVGAQLYLSPRPTPPLVGHTYITYQPLMPHEFLYRHHRKYVYYHGGGSTTKTKIWWR